MPAKPKLNASPSSDDASKRKPMPFEPRKQVEKRAEKVEKQTSKPSAATTRSRQTAQGIPDVVSRRMVQRVALFCGVPTALGMATFILSYLAVSQSWFAVPTYAVLFVSLGWFGLGVLGVSYGALSASWDEDRAGGIWGFAEFKTNLARTTAAWRNQKQ